MEKNRKQRLALLDSKPPGKILIHEIYHSIQGESTYAGLPCVFVRLAVCDARCTWCDTPHAFNQGTSYSADEIIQTIHRFDCPLVEITGGEPLLQAEVYPLMTELTEKGYAVLLETSGAHDISRVDTRVHIIMDVKCPDSGEMQNNHWENLDLLKKTDEIKFVVASLRDFQWAKEIVKKNRLDQRFRVLISPCFEQVSLEKLAEWILQSRLQVRMQLQMHKYIWDPQRRGV